MTPDVVVDIGNTRMKWGRCAGGRVAEMVSLPLDGVGEWAAALDGWRLGERTEWAVASVNPPVARQFGEWARGHGRLVQVWDHRDLPIRVNVAEPEKVGIDRLMAAIAAHHLSAPRPAIAISVGTAVTVDFIDGTGVFHGGAIMPGPRLMGLSLHEHTAKLPLIDPQGVAPNFPCGKTTAGAIHAGIIAALTGGVMQLVSLMGDEYPEQPRMYVTGGGLGLLVSYRLRDEDVRPVPTLTLEGIRIAAGALP